MYENLAQPNPLKVVPTYTSDHTTDKVRGKKLTMAEAFEAVRQVYDEADQRRTEARVREAKEDGLFGDELRIRVYQQDDWWLGECAELNLVAQAQTELGAYEELGRLIVGQRIVRQEEGLTAEGGAP